MIHYFIVNYIFNPPCFFIEFLVDSWITFKCFQFFNWGGFLYIHCRFSYLSIEFWGSSGNILSCLKNLVWFLYLWIHRAFSWIFCFRFFFYYPDLINWFYVTFSFIFSCFRNFPFNTLFPFMKYGYFSSVFLCFFLKLNFPLDYIKFCFCLYVMVTRRNTEAVAYITSLKASNLV